MLKHLGVPARDTQLILGHSNVTTTQQLYQHGDTDAQREALERVEHALLRTPATPGATVDSSAGTGVNCGQEVMSNPNQAISNDLMQDRIVKEKRRLTEVKTAAFLGGPGGTRTHDILLKRTAQTLSEVLPTSVIRALLTTTLSRLVGLAAVSNCCQTVPSPVAPGDRYAHILTERGMYHDALIMQLQRRSFPLNLVPQTPAPHVSATHLEARP